MQHMIEMLWNRQMRTKLRHWEIEIYSPLILHEKVLNTDQDIYKLCYLEITTKHNEYGSLYCPGTNSSA